MSKVLGLCLIALLYLPLWYVLRRPRRRLRIVRDDVPPPVPAPNGRPERAA